MKKIINEIGNIYGMLTVIDRAKDRPFDKKRNALWLCKCQCGKEKEIIGYNLRGGHSTSCGCQIYKKKSKHSAWNGYEDLSGTFYGAMKDNARHRNMEFQLTIEYLWELFLKQNKLCSLTGLEIGLPQKCKDTDHTASLDRID